MEHWKLTVNLIILCLNCSRSLRKKTKSLKQFFIKKMYLLFALNINKVVFVFFVFYKLEVAICCPAFTCATGAGGMCHQSTACTSWLKKVWLSIKGLPFEWLSHARCFHYWSIFLVPTTVIFDSPWLLSLETVPPKKLFPCGTLLKKTKVCASHVLSHVLEKYKKTREGM